MVITALTLLLFIFVFHSQKLFFFHLTLYLFKIILYVISVFLFGRVYNRTYSPALCFNFGTAEVNKGAEEHEGNSRLLRHTPYSGYS